MILLIKCHHPHVFLTVKQMSMNWFKYSTMSVIAIGVFLSILTTLAVFYGTNNGSFKVDVESKSQHLKSIKGDENDPITLKLDYFYTIRDVVECIDTLMTTHGNETLSIVFMGDSIVRNQFSIFMKFFPDYDKSVSKLTPWSITNYHEDVHITHGLLRNFKTSFLWRPMIIDALLSDFKRWNMLDEREVPYLIFLGATIHHMLPKDKKGGSFEQRLELELLPVLRDYLVTHPNRQLVWLIQPPTLDKQASIPGYIIYYPEIHYDMIGQYNEIVRKIFNGTRILLMEFDTFIEEYIRSCILVNYQRENFQDYFYCNENHHSPTALMFSFTTHLLFQQLCNPTN